MSSSDVGYEGRAFNKVTKRDAAIAIARYDRGHNTVFTISTPPNSLS
jgi:hypothetical protein